ncbi:alpha/beta fold hydrolase [Pseudonocardia humida]|uniref:Alpha/beta fold hydrolase n=1 Tax=Pseudonocardia humida TaxID=2800819 RepID=A0ABT1A4Z8_9PSEU|nr:alpha/beta fold hydrolase [Pseudonocardia humida]MCO1657844.1 alpha/beta fold hydrolase [Pseudonocardia humida]
MIDVVGPSSVRWMGGEGVTRVVAVPGLGLSADVPARTLARLAPTASVALALPGYGEPARRDAPRAPADLAAHLLDRLERLDVPPAVLLGHSASCQVVAHAAAMAPDRVTALLLVGPTTDPRAAGWPALAGRWLRTAAHERPGQVPQLARDYTRTGAAAMGRAMDAARRDRIDRVLPALRCPVLIVRGRHDRISPADWVCHLASLASAGRARTVPAGAHMIPLTHPRLVAPLLGDLLG